MPLATGCGSGDTFTLNYGTSTTKITAPSNTIGTATFTTQTQDGGGTLTAIASSPSETVTWSSSTPGTYSITVLANSAVSFTNITGAVPAAAVEAPIAALVAAAGVPAASPARSRLSRPLTR